MMVVFSINKLGYWNLTSTLSASLMECFALILPAKAVPERAGPRHPYAIIIVEPLNRLGREIQGTLTS